MTRLLFSFGIGLLFGSGLYLSGMTSPSKVLGFLDLFGAWDPSLALVMSGAVAVGLVAFQLAARRRRTLLGGEIHFPKAAAIDPPLILGSVIFGVGWGLAGICPGPGIVDAGFLDPNALIFVAAMTIGMALQKLSTRVRRAGARIRQDG
jgi:uncharacterized membrane protein YedE/YeeE